MKAVKVLRARKGWTIQELSDASGVPRDTISRVEHGHNKPRATTLKRLADALGVDAEYVYLLDERYDAPGKGEAPTLAEQWLNEATGHHYLTTNVAEAEEVLGRTPTPTQVSRLKSDLRDEWTVISEALDGDISPELEAELLSAKRTYVEWMKDITKLVRRLQQEEARGWEYEERQR